jgi:hypothetical protein
VAFCNEAHHFHLPRCNRRGGGGGEGGGRLAVIDGARGSPRLGGLCSTCVVLSCAPAQNLDKFMMKFRQKSPSDRAVWGSIHCLLTVHSLPIHCLFTAYSLPIHCLFTAYSLLIHRLFTAYSLPIHCLFTAYSPPIHCLFTVYSLSIHCLFTAYALPIHCLFTQTNVRTSERKKEKCTETEREC